MPLDIGRTLLAHADAAQAVHAAPTDEQRQILGAQYAVDLVPGCTHAGVIQRRRRGTHTVVATDEVARLADAFENEMHTGPGTEALSKQTRVVSTELCSESRWEPWTHYARTGLGVQAVIAVPLADSARSFGALNLYFDQQIEDPEQTIATAETFATHLALALGCGLTIENQAAAIENRTVIGQAQGILIATSQLSAEAAFAYLRRLSQHSNRKLRDIAVEVVHNKGPIRGVAHSAPHDGGAFPSSAAAADRTED